MKGRFETWLAGREHRGEIPAQFVFINCSAMEDDYEPIATGIEMRPIHLA
jgi:hypothetical protein